MNTEELSSLQKLLVNDPQTSGGLLLSVKKKKASAVVKQLQNKFQKTAVIGEVFPQSQHWVNIE